MRIGSTRVALISSVKCTSLIRPPRFPSKSLFFPTSLSPPRFSCSLFCFHSFRTLLLPPRFPSLPTPTPSSFLPFPPYPIRAFRSPSISLSLSSLHFFNSLRLLVFSFRPRLRHGFKNVYDEARCPCGLALTHRRFSDPRDSERGGEGEGKKKKRNRPIAGSTQAQRGMMALWNGVHPSGDEKERGGGTR